MKLWVKWEQLDIAALLECIEMKTHMDMQRQKRMLKKVSNMREMDKLNKGQKTIKSIFMSKNGKVNKITTLKHKIEDVNLLFSYFLG